MRYKSLFSPDDYVWFLDLFDDGTEEHKARFLQQTHKRMLDADSPLEVAQKVLQAKPTRLLRQKVLQANSSVELALKAIDSEEQLNEFLSRIQQRSQKMASTITQQAAASA
jgi:ribosomal protein S10